MLRAIIEEREKALSKNPALRSHAPTYRSGEVNRCPGCGRTHWYVGRVLAECGFCATALPLQDASTRGNGTLRGTRAVFPERHQDEI